MMETKRIEDLIEQLERVAHAMALVQAHLHELERQAGALAAEEV